MIKPLLRRGGHRRVAVWQEGGDEGGVEVIDVLEVFDPVVIALRKDAFGDEVKDDFAHVARASDAPVCEECGDHRAVFVQEVVAESAQQLWSTEVGGLGFVLAGVLGHGVVQRGADEGIGLRREA